VNRLRNRSGIGPSEKVFGYLDHVEGSPGGSKPPVVLRKRICFDDVAFRSDFDTVRPTGVSIGTGPGGAEWRRQEHARQATAMFPQSGRIVESGAHEAALLPSARRTTTDLVVVYMAEIVLHDSFSRTVRETGDHVSGLINSGVI